MSGAMRKKRVLLVDDNSIVRSAVRRLFDSYPDFKVSGEAENGREGIEKAASLKPDLIVLDLAMPVMNGLDAASEIRKVLPGARLILLTAHNGPEVERLSRAAGVHAVVPKSQAAAKLIAQARALLTPGQED
jgi:two-component system nitrate/nitrite response regulator NarL